MRTGPAGVTLVELLVAMVVALLLAGILLSAHHQTSRAWSAAEARIQRSRQFEIVAELLAHDLSRAVSYSGLASMSMVTIEDAAGEGLDPGSRSLHLLAAVENEGLGEICAISYRCRFSERLQGYALYRHVLNSDELARRLVGIRSRTGRSPTDPSEVFEFRSTDEGEEIGAYVWNFQPEFLGADGRVLTAETFRDGTLPAAVRVSFTVAAATGERIQRVGELGLPFWNIPTSHHYQQAFEGSDVEVTREFRLPEGWPPMPPDPYQQTPRPTK